MEVRTACKRRGRRKPGPQQPYFPFPAERTTANRVRSSIFVRDRHNHARRSRKEARVRGKPCGGRSHGLEAEGESLADRHDRGPGGVYGGARHHHRQRGPASYRRQPGRQHDESTWVLTSYLVSNAIVLPLGGWASSLMGRRNFFVFCIFVFTTASFLCGIAPSLTLLLIFRVIQGAGGGGLQPMAQAIMADSFEPQQRGQAFALYGLVAVLAPSIGPTLGGWITDNFSWRWIFFMNIPVGIMAFILVTRIVDDPPWIKPDRSRLRHMDYLGLSFLALAMGSMQIMLDKGEENDWFQSNFIRLFGFLFVFGMIGLVVWEWRQKSPLINLKLFRFKNFAICCFLMMLVGGVLNANTVLQPQFTQELLGYTATIAGLALTAGGIALVIVMPLAGYATGKVSARTLTVIGFTLFVITFRYAADVTNLQMSFAEASWLRVVQMVPIPFCFISITNAAYVGMPKEESNQVAGLINFARNIGGSILIAVTNAQVTTPRHVAPAAPAKRHAARLHRLSAARAGAHRLLWQRTSAGPTPMAWPWPPSITSSTSRRRCRATRTSTWSLAVMSVVLIALAFLLSKSRPGAGPGAGAMH